MGHPWWALVLAKDGPTRAVGLIIHEPNTAQKCWRGMTVGSKRSVMEDAQIERWGWVLSGPRPKARQLTEQGHLCFPLVLLLARSAGSGTQQSCLSSLASRRKRRRRLPLSASPHPSGRTLPLPKGFWSDFHLLSQANRRGSVLLWVEMLSLLECCRRTCCSIVSICSVRLQCFSAVSSKRLVDLVCFVRENSCSGLSFTRFQIWRWLPFSWNFVSYLRSSQIFVYILFMHDYSTNSSMCFGIYHFSRNLITFCLCIVQFRRFDTSGVCWIFPRNGLTWVGCLW